MLSAQQTYNWQTPLPSGVRSKFCACTKLSTGLNGPRRTLPDKERIRRTTNGQETHVNGEERIENFALRRTDVNAIRQSVTELVQNAEDARAREVHIIYDARNCNAQLDISAGTNNGHLKALKGPGLCVYNNEQFSKADWQGIRSIQNSVKEEDRLTVGRFGLGFKSVFHLSDWPCVLSGKYILFINPHESVDKVCLINKLANLDATSQQACMDVFSGNFGFSRKVFTEGEFRGTMFWFPLRRTTSALSDNIYDQSKIEDLFCTFQAEAKMTLLFLKYVESIHLKKKDHLEEIHSVFSVMIAPQCLNDIRRIRKSFVSKIQDFGTNLPEKSIQSDQQILIETESESSGTSTEEWIVTNFYKGGQVSEVFSKLLHDTDLSYSPYVGMATPLHHDATFHGHIFCFLPLPLDARNHTGLPVHINGFFALSQNRAYVKWPTTEQERTHSHLDKSVQWNKCLVKEVLPEVYVRLVQWQIAYSQSNGNSPQDVQLVYSSLPLPSVVRENWNLILQPFYDQLWQLPVLYTSNQQGKWICLQVSVLAVYRDDVPLKVQKTVTETYRRYNRNIVVLPPDLLASVKKYSAISPEYVECQTLCTLLRSNDTYKTFSREDRRNLLTFILKFDSSCLHGLELLPVADGSFVTFPAKVVFCPGKAHLFPGLERKVIADNIDQEVLRKLGHMAKNACTRSKKFMSGDTHARKTESVAATGSSAPSITELVVNVLKTLLPAMLKERMASMVAASSVAGSCSGADPMSAVAISGPVQSVSMVPMACPAASSKRPSTITGSSEHTLKTVSSKKHSEWTESSKWTKVSKQTEKTVSHRSSHECSGIPGRTIARSIAAVIWWVQRFIHTIPDAAPVLDDDTHLLGKPSPVEFTDSQAQTMDTAQRRCLHVLSYLDVFLAAMATQVKDARCYALFQQSAQMLAFLTSSITSMSTMLTHHHRQAFLRKLSLDSQRKKELLAQPWSASTLFVRKTSEVVAANDKDQQSTATIKALQLMTTLESNKRMNTFSAQPFFKYPPLTLTPREKFHSAAHVQVLQDSVNKLLKKGAVCRIPLVDLTPGFYCDIFLVPKKDSQDLRMIHSMTITWILHPSSRCSCHYEWTVLPFGISVAPWLFMRITAPVSQFLHHRGIYFYPYLDDCLMKSRSKTQLSIHVYFILQFLQSLGLDHLLREVSVASNAGLTVHRSPSVTRSRPCSSSRRSLDQDTVNDHQSLDVSDVFPRMAESSGSLKIHLLVDLQPSLHWWQRQSNVLDRVSLRPFQATHHLFTDASLEGWGVHLSDQTLSRPCSPEEANLHINLLEMLAVYNAILHWRPRLIGVSLMVATDGVTMAAYISRQGASSLCVTSPRSRHHSLGHQLESDGRVHISASNPAAQSVAEISAVPLPSSLDLSNVANENVVSRPHQTRRPTFSTSTRLGSSAVTSHIKVTPSAALLVPATCVDIIIKGLKKKAFSSKTSAAILRAHRSSATAAYNVRWLCFHRWCIRQKLRPQSILVPHLADFLMYLRTSLKLKGSTIAGYVSVISMVHDPATTTKLSAIPEIHKMIKGLSWKIKSITFVHRTAWVSEIHALDVDLVRFHHERSSVTLGLLMNYVAKNQLPDPRSYMVQALSSIVGLDDVEDLSLCPSSKRHYQEYGIYLDPVYDPICIPEGRLAAPSASNPHELHALAATMSLHCNTLIQHILTGCFWATDSIFANYYLQDVSTEDVEGFHHLGPVVAVQTLELYLPLLTDAPFSGCCYKHHLHEFVMGIPRRTYHGEHMLRVLTKNVFHDLVKDCLDVNLPDEEKLLRCSSESFGKDWLEKVWVFAHEHYGNVQSVFKSLPVIPQFDFSNDCAILHQLTQVFIGQKLHQMDPLSTELAEALTTLGMIVLSEVPSFISPAVELGLIHEPSNSGVVRALSQVFNAGKGKEAIDHFNRSASIAQKQSLIQYLQHCGQTLRAAAEVFDPRLTALRKLFVHEDKFPNDKFKEHRILEEMCNLGLKQTVDVTSEDICQSAKTVEQLLISGLKDEAVKKCKLQIDKLKLVTVDKCTYCKEEWMREIPQLEDSNTEDSDTVWYVHQDVPPTLAKMLGVETRSEKHLLHYMKDFTPFGQHENLTRRIKRILSGYPLDSAVMKELLQNADDAKATEIMFIKDFRTHPSERVFGDAWSELQGPALCVYNDSYFREEDFVGLEELGLGSKSEDLVKIGQYGVGFNCVYHLTDVPCFLTVCPDTEEETLCILDPNIKYIEIANEYKPGARVSVNDYIRTFYQDVFAGFPTAQVNMTNQGTLFRLPLRTATMADKSAISDCIVSTQDVVEILNGFKKDMFKITAFLAIMTVSLYTKVTLACDLVYATRNSNSGPKLAIKPSQVAGEGGEFRGTMFWFPLRSTSSTLSDNIYDQSKIEDLFCTFQAEAKMTLLFLKYVESIHLKKKDHLEEIHSVFSVMIAPQCLNDIRRIRESFVSKIQDVGTNLPEKSIQSDQQILIEMESESSGISTEEWIVTNFYKGGQVSEVFSKLLHDTDLSYSPYVGMATPLHHDTTFHGHIFCFLPLPLDARNQTGLPVHINGFFALSQNRAYVKWPTTDQERTHSHLDKSVQWNKCLVKEVLPEVYVKLVQRQIAYSQSNGNSPQDVQHVYSSLPLPSVVRENWNLILQPFYDQLWQLPVLYTSNQRGKWICLQDSVLAVYRDDVPLKVQQAVTETYRRYNRNIVVLPVDLLATVKKYSAIPPEYVECQTLCTLLRSNDTYKTFLLEDRLNLLTFILKFDSSCLHGLELLPVADGSFVTFPAKVFFCPGKAHLFPGLERKVIADNIDQEVLRKLGHMAKNGEHMLRALTKDVFHDLVKDCLDVNLPDEEKLLRCSSKSFGKDWLEKVWVFAHEHYGNVQSVFKSLPVIPQFDFSNDCAMLHQLTQVFIGQKLHQMDPLSTELAEALTTLGMIVLSEVPNFLSAAVELGLIHEPSNSGVVRALSQVFNAGKGKEAIDHFNRSASIAQKRSLIQYLQHCGRIPNPAKNILTCLKLFSRTSCKTPNVLDTCIKDICHIAPDAHLPVAYPKDYLDCSQPVARYFAKLLGAVKHTVYDIVLDILNIIENGNQTQYSSTDIESFMMFLMQNRQFFVNQKIKEKAKTVKFLSPLKGQTLRAAAEVFDPRLTALQKLFVHEDKFPNDKFKEHRILEEMHCLGLKQTADVTSEDICQSAKTVEQLLISGLKDEAVKKGHAVLKFLINNLDTLSVAGLKSVLSIQWVPVLLSKPTNYPEKLQLYSEYIHCTLGRPNEMTCIQHHPLVGSTCLVAADEVSHNIANMFGWNKSPILDKVVAHILNTVGAMNEDEYDKVITIMNSSFKHLYYSQPLPQKIQEKLKDARLVWIESESEFQKPNVLWIDTSEHDIDLDPFRYCLPKHLRGLRELFVALGSALNQTADMLLDVLEEIKIKHDKGEFSETDAGKDLALVIQILNVIKTKPTVERKRIFIPVQATDRQLRLVTVDKCTYCKDEWMREIPPLEDSKTEDDDVVWYVHQDVPPSLAKMLGVETKSEKHLLLNMKDITPFGQHEKLTRRIKSILSGYPLDSAVMKELLQNADDAKATEIMFIKDFRTHPSERVFGDAWSELQGPALCVYNDSYFREEDFTGLEELGHGSKSEDLVKIGQYGVGFNCVYHLTDVPCFLTVGPDTEETMCILDPNTQYCQVANKCKSGARITVKDYLRSEYEHVFVAFPTAQVSLKSQGTLFRLPLRTATMAEKSAISDCIVCPQDVIGILNDLKKDMFKSLLFLHNMRKISIASIADDGTMHVEYMVETEMTLKDKMKQAVFVEQLKTRAENVVDFSMGIGMTDLSVFEIQLELNIKDNENRHEKWLVVHRAGFSTDYPVPELLSKAWANGDIRYLPQGGIAVNLELDSVPDTTTKHAFCMLPLPIETGLPVHVNGHFALDHESRRNLWTGTNDYRTVWNTHLVRALIVPAYFTAMQSMKAKHFAYCGGNVNMSLDSAEGVIAKYNSLFPDIKTCPNEPWKSLVITFYKEIINKKLFMFVIQPHQEKKTKEKKNIVVKNQAMRLECAPAVVDNGFPGHFMDLDVYFPDVKKKREQTTSSEEHVPENSSQKKKFELTCILKDLGMKLIDAPMGIYLNFQEIGVEDQVSLVTPKNVVKFLKSHSVKTLPGKCCIGNLPTDVECTPLKESESVKCLIKFCQIEENFWDELEGMPLLLTQSGELDTFTEKNPILVSTYADLLHGSSSKLICKSLVNLFEKKVTKVPQLRRLDIEAFSKLLDATLDHSLFGVGIPVPWLENSNYPKKEWISRLWNFLSEELECTKQGKVESTKQEEKNIKPQSTKLQEIENTATEQKIKSTDFKKEERYGNAKVALVELLQNWSLMPVIWNKKVGNDENSVANKYLFPLKCAKRVFYGTVTINEELKEALHSLVVPKLDLAAFDIRCFLLPSSWDRKNSWKLASELVTTPSSPIELLGLLVSYIHKDTFCKTFGRTLLEYFSKNVKELAETSNTEDCKQMLKTLTFFKKLDNSYTSLAECENIVFVKDHMLFPKDGVVDWCSETTISIFEEEPVLSKLYDFLNLNPISEVRLYSDFFFPRFQLFSTETKSAHLEYLKKILVKYEKLNEEAETLLQILTQIPFIETEDGTLHKASRFYSKKEKVFQVMCDKSDFPPHQFDGDEWHDFLVLAGIITEVSDDMFIEYATAVARKGCIRISKEVAKMSMVLMNHLKPQTFEEKRSTNKEQLQLLFKTIRNIRFILPFDISNIRDGHLMSSICPQFEGAARLVSFKDSACQTYPIYQIWSTYPVLCDQASSVKEFYTKVQPDEPPKKVVIKHMINICSCKQIDGKSFLHNDTRQFVEKVMRSLYQYFDKTGLSGSDVEQLSSFKTVFLPDECMFVKAEHVVIEPENNELISGYLYKAPTTYGRFFKVFHKLGAIKIATANHYASILIKLYQETKGGKLNPNEQKTVNQAITQLFHCLKVENKKELHSKHLYLPKRDHALTNSSELVMIDDKSFKERISCLNLSFLLDFKTMGCKEIDPIKALKSLPRKYQPKLLTDIVQEKVLSQNDRVFSTKYMNVLHSDPFISGIVRLVSQMKNKKDLEFFENDAREIELKLTSLKIFEMEELTTVLYYQDKMIPESQESKQCFIDYKTEKHECVYLKANTHDNKSIYVETNKLAQAVNLIIGEQLNDLILHLPQMMQCEPDTICTYLDQQGINNCIYDISENDVTWMPSAGDTIPEDFHWMLVNRFDWLEVGEYVGMEVYDPLSDVDTAEECVDEPRYCYAVVKEIKKHSTSPIFCQYVVDVGNGRRELMSATTLFKMYRPKIADITDLVLSDAIPIQNDDTVNKSLADILKNIRKVLKECWKNLDDVHRRKVRNRLYLRWHPDRNLERKELCNTVCQYLKQYVEKLDRGESIENMTVEDDILGGSRYYRWSDDLNQRASNHRHHWENAKQEGSSYFHKTRRSTKQCDPQEAQRWLRQAEIDYDSARQDATFNWICFKCYQAAKKAIAALHYNTVNTGENTTNIHDLEKLTEKVYDPTLITLVRQLKSTIKDHVRLLYPDPLTFPRIPSDVYTEEDARQACEITGRIIELVKQKLG
ncbi:LOW QUALITY PROTEIN: sacsin-like [Gigantopelta aegis]|uniref:LOW QUALITY PROTEIN: sacsin-like n=1 Tax=Gigantopelta aegis TaxID=1735272 RepID=UPI001B8882AB|nr:LOW QUALITY PROTEIN: sacsin-like [Gigantopelta aegis]